MSPTNKPRRSRPPTPPPTPKPPQPWDAPPRPALGDASPDTTFTAVGKALSNWEYYEGYVGLVFGLLTGNTDNISPATRAYGAVSSYSTRSDMILEASKAFFFLKLKGFKETDPGYAKISQAENNLKQIIDEAKNFSTRRNEIAHGIVQPYYPGGLTRPGYALGPSKHATRKLKLKRDLDLGVDVTENVYAYTKSELDAFSDYFNNLAQRTMDIYVQLHAVRRIRPEE